MCCPIGWISAHGPRSRSRGTSPVVGVVLLLGITVVTAATVGLAISTEPPGPHPTATFELAALADTNELQLTHGGGDTVDVEATTIRIEVDGERLATQPTVPYFSITGFDPGPTGPLNSASPNQWKTGETGTLRVSQSNSPTITRGSTVTVRIQTETALIWEGSTTAR